MFFNAAETLPRGLFKACVVPRPIAWISTVSKEGQDNLAPFSYFNIVSENPPMVMFSTTDMHHEGGEKDTLKNVEETGEFVVNITSLALKKEMNITSMDFPRHISEFDAGDIEKKPAVLVKPKCVKKAPVSLECKYYKSIQLPLIDNEKQINRLVIGTVIGIHVCPSILDKEGRIDITQFNPLARLGYNSYLAVKDTFDMHRPILEPLNL